MREILLTSSVLILALLILRHLFRNTISRRLQYALWGLVLVRLLVPVSLPAMEHNVLTAAEPVRQSVSVRLEDRKLYVLPTEQVELPAPEERAPELQPGYEMAVQSTGVMVVDDGGDTATVYTGWITAKEALRLVWYAGMAVMTAWFLLINLRFFIKLDRNQKEYPVEGCKYPVYLVETGLPSPCIFGPLRPTVYLTPAAVETPEALRHVLAHEMTHARHRDPLWSFLRCVCLTVYWFDPLVWVAAIVSRKDCELACDEGALKKLGEAERIPYGRTLLRLIPVAKHPGSPMLSATTMTAGKKELKDRITRIAENRRTVGVALLAVLTAAALVCAVTFTAAKPQPLTWDELISYTNAFNSIQDGIYVRQFLTSHYEEAGDIDLGELFYNFKITEESAPYYGDENFTDEEVNTILYRFMGYTLSDERLYNLRTYNSRFYKNNWVEGSSNDSGFIRFWAGARQGDHISLYYHANTLHIINGHYELHFAENGENWGKVTLQPQSDGGFHILSNEPCDRPDKLLGEARPLTGEELTFFNSDDLRAAYDAFLYPLFAAPRDIDLFSLLYHSTALHETPDAAETELARAELGPYDTLVKLTTAAIDDYLMEYTGLTLAETSQVGLESFAYLADYDAYYQTVEEPTSRDVRFTGGSRQGDIIRLYWEDFRYGAPSAECATLLDRGNGHYWFLSHTLVDTDVAAIPTVYPEETPWMSLSLRSLSHPVQHGMDKVRHSDDCAQQGAGIQAESSPDAPTHSIRVYDSTDGNLYLAIMRNESTGRNGQSYWEADVFFTVPQEGLSNTVDNVSLSFFDDLLGFESGFTFTYSDYITGGPGQGGEIGNVTDYYTFYNDGSLVRIARAYGDCDIIDLNGDGENELCAVSSASGQVFYYWAGQIYEVDIKSILTNTWPELQCWEGGKWDYNYRRLAVYGTVKMPEWGGDATADFTRYVYLDEDSLLVYKPTEQATVDHVMGTLENIPDNVLAAAKATVLADYQTEKDTARYGDTLPDDWRIESLTYAGRYHYTGGDIVVYNLNYEFHAGAPAKVIRTEDNYIGDSYITENGWYTNGSPYRTCLFFLIKYDQWTFLDARTVYYCDDPYIDQWAEELGIYNEADAESDQTLTLLHTKPRQFISQLAEMEETEQRALCRQLWEYQKNSGASDNGYDQLLFIQGIRSLHTLQETTTYSLNDREAAAFDILLQEAHSDEAAEKAQTILNALTAQGPIQLSHWDSLLSSDFTFTYEPTEEAVAAFADHFYWTDTGVLPDSVWEHRPRLILRSANEDITLTVFEYSSERIYCTYRGQTYGFLAASKTADPYDQPFDYLYEWFDEALRIAFHWT